MMTAYMHAAQPHAPAIAARRARPCPLNRSHRSLWLAAINTAPGVARGAIREWLPVVGLAVLEDTVTQVASEMVANAVEESAQWALRTLWPLQPSLRVVLDTCGDHVLIEVWDLSEQAPVAGELPAWGSERGRGLFIVEALAERWGWRPRTDMPGKCVWALVG
jgi:hypothetical protein